MSDYDNDLIEQDDPDNDYQSRAEWREKPLFGDGDRDWKLDR